MCSTVSTIKCLFITNESIYSEPYLPNKPKAIDTSLTEIRIIFKNRIKLLKGINSSTTFGDLKLALLISRNQAKADTREKSSYASKKWCICQSMNKVEKIMSSDLNVQNEMRRSINERVLTNNEFNVIYIMRLKSNLQKVSSREVLAGENVTSNKIPILAEFCPKIYKKKIAKPKSTATKVIESALKNFDKHIDERKKLVKLLEEYYETLDCFDEDKSDAQSTCNSSQTQESDRFYAISKLKVKDSMDSSFNVYNYKCETYV